MNLRFLGTGSAFSRTMYNTNCLVEFEHYRLLIDCGHTAGRSLYELGLEWKDIDYIFITHLHADHIGGLEECALMNHFVYERKCMLMASNLILVDVGNWLMTTVRHTTEGRLTIRDYFSMLAINPNYWQLELVMYPLAHTQRSVPGVPLESTALGLDSGGEKVLYVADTAELMSLQTYEEYPLIFHDCEFASPSSGMHTSFAQLKTLPSHIRNRMYLMHYGDNWTCFEEEAHSLGFKFAEQHKLYTIGE